jgi:RNA polymerase sigma-70 factor (ECF subfamily)
MSQTSENLGDLVRKASAGDRAAWQALYEAVTPRLYQRLTRLTADLNVVEDVLQETWRKFWERPAAFDPDRSFLPWITRVACNLLMDWYRRSRRAPVSLVDDEILGDGVPPADWMSALEDADRLRHCMDGLPQESRGILRLHFWERVPFCDIAARLGSTRTEAGIRSVYYRALEKLKACMQLGGPAVPRGVP